MEVSDLGSIVDPSEAAWPAKELSSLGLAEGDALRERVAQFTQQIFGQLPCIQPEVDPETGEKSLAVCVSTSAEVSDVLRMNDVWHRSLRTVTGDAANAFRLSLDVQ